MKDKIINTAAELFSAHGYHNTSIDDIASAAGIAKGSVYYHFQNKSQLFCETVLSGIHYFESQILTIKEASMPAEIIAENIISLTTELFIEHKSIADMVMMRITDGLDADAAKQIQDAREHMIDTLANTMSEGSSCGSLKSCHTAAIARGMVSFIYSCCLHADSADMHDIKHEISDILMTGILRKSPV